VVPKDTDTRTLVESGADLVVVAGGDGTVAAAARTLAGRRLPLAILPVGTANNIAGCTRATGSLDEIIDRWRDARREPFDLGILSSPSGEEYFVEGIGGGLMPAGIEAMTASTDGDTADAASMLCRALSTFRHTLAQLKPRRWTLRLDGALVEGEFLVVEALNTCSVGPNLLLAPDASPSDGLLSVVLADESQREAIDDYLRQRVEDKPAGLSLPSHAVTRLDIERAGELHVDDEVRTDARGASISLRVHRAALELLG
jgi:diacylglycerol kinase family enzyme